jgi:hypothetical protein
MGAGILQINQILINTQLALNHMHVHKDIGKHEIHTVQKIKNTEMKNTTVLDSERIKHSRKKYRNKKTYTVVCEFISFLPPRLQFLWLKHLPVMFQA